MAKNKFDTEDEVSEEELLKEQQKEWDRIEKGKQLNSKIRELAPQIVNLPHEAVTCAKYALMYVKCGNPDELIPFPKEDGTAPEIPASEVVKMLGIESLV
jgi:hypothetical protein